MHSYTCKHVYTLLIVKMFKLPVLIRCEPPADYVSSRHLPYPCDCLNLSPSSALSHFCIVVWPVAILKFEYIMHSYNAVIKMLINI